MPKSLRKVQKKLAKKGAKVGSLHERSRDSQRLKRASGRNDKLARMASARSKLNDRYLKRVLHFQAAAESSEAISLPGIHKLIRTYIDRSAPELEALQKERRPGQPASQREDLLKQRISSEEREYLSGFWIPDVENLKNLRRLRDWTGDWVSLGTMEFVRMDQEGKRKASTFPPNGVS